MGYARRGDKYRFISALAAGTPGFSMQYQLTLADRSRNNSLHPVYIYLFCGWKTAWRLLYRPASESDRNFIDNLMENCGAERIHDLVKGDIQDIYSFINRMNDIVNLLERICTKTYIMESGWEIIRRLGQTNLTRPDLSYCTYQTVTLHENFIFDRPLTVTVAINIKERGVHFHQMTVDNIKNCEYVLQNNEFTNASESD
ncbi:Oidioi.mRNA.OKI2018_I69.chr1.g2663.t1.cds [Oikopleura dioica]|uniref:Oidioi.mRNA.OKI2018_I69.chr1.g2663.t1.cds n=1 Tax=Oikopleura dioica TaxID=34765 RepID=A0ABN7SW45_OIKDI|nr:Oidioi.mRNA.OKI2018_I69.chr1.g2663.t1.cds [Oikopleura dioica]